MPFYAKGDVQIHYEEVGSGFPLLVTPGGGLNSVISGWPNQVFNAQEVFGSELAWRETGLMQRAPEAIARIGIISCRTR